MPVTRAFHALLPPSVTLCVLACLLPAWAVPTSARGEKIELQDRSKHAIEQPARRLATNFGGGESKAVIEETPSSVTDATEAFTDSKTKAFVNPSVAPGKVNWHVTFDAACSAAESSGKPVLLFQMMGQLDQEFC